MKFGAGKLFGIDTAVAFEGSTVVGLYFCSDARQLMLDFDIELSDKDDDAAAALLADIERGKAIKFDFIAPSEFERLVWDALVGIQPGCKVTYGQLATTIGRPKAVRAVASAIGRNPISYIVPCHRVIRADGSLGGYRWGLDIKRALLERESLT